MRLTLFLDHDARRDALIAVDRAGAQLYAETNPTFLRR